MTERWFEEKHTPNVVLKLAVGETLFDEHSPYQHVQILETLQYGRMMLLNGCVMLTEEDEFVYHEMLVHVPLFAHGSPEHVLIIGGGDGGSVREALKHPTVKSVTLVEIDEMVIDASKRFLPTLSSGFDDPRVTVCVEDGFDHLEEHEGAYDVVLTDSLDPVGESAKLFTSPYYDRIHDALRPGGVAAFQTESPFHNRQVVGGAYNKLSRSFKQVHPYLAAIPTYPSGLWSFTFASDAVDPAQAQPRFEAPFLDELKYFNPQVFRAAFALPNFVKRLLVEGE